MIDNGSKRDTDQAKLMGNGKSEIPVTGFPHSPGFPRSLPVRGSNSNVVVEDQWDRTRRVVLEAANGAIFTENEGKHSS